MEMKKTMKRRNLVTQTLMLNMFLVNVRQLALFFLTFSSFSYPTIYCALSKLIMQQNELVKLKGLIGQLNCISTCIGH